MAAKYRRCRRCNHIHETTEKEYFCNPCTLAIWLGALSFWERVRLAIRIVIKGGEYGR